MATALQEQKHSARNTVMEIEIDLVYPSKLNPRQEFDEAALQELASSIRQHGLLQPILVRPVSQTIMKNGVGAAQMVYEIVAGERRWRACKLIELPTILAVVDEMDEKTHVQLALIENLQRQDLNPMEEARGYAELNRVCGLKQSEIAASVNRSQPSIANKMRLLKLPLEVQEKISAGELSPAHGIALGRFDGFSEIQKVIAEHAIADKLTSKDLENGIRGSHILTQKGLMSYLPWQYESIEKACRKECPFSAYHHTGGSGVCFNPPCLKEKESQAQQTKEEEKQQKISAAIENGETSPVKMHDFEYGSYNELTDSNTPSGCLSECLQRVAATSHSGVPTVICLDVKCHKRLRTADTKAANKNKNATAAENLKKIKEVIDGLTEISPQEISFLCAMVLQNERSAKSQDVFKEFGIVIPMRDKYAEPVLNEETLTQIAVNPSLQLVRAVLTSALTRQVEARLEDTYYSNKDKRLEWYLQARENAERGATLMARSRLVPKDNEPPLPGFAHLVYPDAQLEEASK